MTHTPIKKTLIQIINERDDAMAEIANSEGEVSEWVGELLSTNKAEEKAKVENYSLVMKEFDLQAHHFEELGNLFIKRAKSYHGLIKRLKEHLRFVMMHDGRQKIEGLTCQFSLRRNKGTLVAEELNLEEMFRGGATFVTKKEIYSLDKDAVRASIERGEHIPWAKIEDSWSLNCSEIKRIELPEGSKNDEK